MHSGISPTHLDQPLTADEAAALARLKQKVARANQFSRLGDHLTSFYRRRYPRWLALNPLLPQYGNRLTIEQCLAIVSVSKKDTIGILPNNSADKDIASQ